LYLYIKMSNQNKAFIWYIDWLIFFVGYEYKLVLKCFMIVKSGTNRQGEESNEQT
jgi:hypothetical protein